MCRTSRSTLPLAGSQGKTALVRRVAYQSVNAARLIGLATEVKDARLKRKSRRPLQRQLQEAGGTSALPKPSGRAQCQRSKKGARFRTFH